MPVALAHAPEDASGHVEQVRGRVELGDLARIEDADPVITNDGTQPICKEDCQEIECSSENQMVRTSNA